MYGPVFLVNGLEEKASYGDTAGSRNIKDRWNPSGRGAAWLMKKAARR
jgi:hypothetical protein